MSSAVSSHRLRLLQMGENSPPRASSRKLAGVMSCGAHIALRARQRTVGHERTSLDLGPPRDSGSCANVLNPLSLSVSPRLFVHTREFTTGKETRIVARGLQWIRMSKGMVSIVAWVQSIRSVLNTHSICLACTTVGAQCDREHDTIAT